MSHELNSLQNAANDLNLIVHQKFADDKRKRINKYFATLQGISVSPELDYNRMNCFLLGWRNCIKHKK